MVESVKSVKIASGSTLPSDWKVYNPKGIKVEVDTSSAGFDNTPTYVTSIHGSVNHWETTGASSIYYATSKGFTVHIRFADDRRITPADASGWGWHIQWIGYSD